MKLFRLFIVVLFTLSVLVSCTPASEIPGAEVPGTEAPAAEAPAATEAPADPNAHKYGGTLTFGIETEPPGFNPIQHDSWYEIWIYATSNEPLTHGGENFGTEWRPILAESWETSEDGKVWTIHLRQGVTWQDGKPFTADDVLYWAEAIVHPDTIDTEWCRSRFMSGEEPFVWEKIDDFTVTVTTADPVPNLMADICVPVIPKHYFVDNNISFADMDKSAFNTTDELLGTGPFRITEYRRGEAVIMTKYKDYWGGEPYLDQIVYRIVPDRQSLITAAQTGEVDYITLDAAEVEQVKDSPNLTIYEYEGDNSWHFRLNIKKPHLADKRTRQALMYAIDRQAFVDSILLGYGRVSDTIFSPYVTAYKPLDDVRDYNPEKAKELLAEVGWVPGTDGILVADTVEGVEKGTRFVMNLEVYSPSKMQPSLLAQSYWTAIGIDAQLRQRDSNVFTEANYGVPAVERDFDAFWTMIGSAGPNGVSYNWLIAAMTEDDAITGYSKQEVLDLFAKAKSAKEPADRDAYLTDAVKIAWDDTPVISVFYSDNIYAVNKRVHFEEAPIDPTMWVQFPDFSKVWVEK